jgi:hypothetical protein
VERAGLKQKLNTAAQGNGVYPQNNPTAWAQNFGNLFAEVIADLLDEISAKAQVAPVDMGPIIQQLTNRISNYMVQTVQSVSSATAGLQRRTNLVWWKQALYSPSKQKTYRTFPPSIASALMAYDLHRQMPMFSPASVSAFLQEAVRSLSISSEADQRSLEELINEASASSVLDELRAEAALLFAKPAGRCPVVALLGYREAVNGIEGRFEAFTGVSKDTKVSYELWASWIFRDLQAGRATKEPSKKPATEGAA